MRQALEETLSKDDAGALTLFPITLREGETRLQVQLFVPAPAGAPGPDAKLAILVKNKAGGDAARLEEVTGFDPARGGYLSSRFFAVPPGDYGVAAGVFDASGKVVASAKRSIAIAAAGKDFSLSPLVVASSFYPVPKSTAEQAFTLNGNHFVTKGERLDPEDGLSFVVRVYNPAVDPASKTVRLSRIVKIKAKGAPAMDVPQPKDEPIPVPDSKEPPGILTVDVAAALIDAQSRRVPEEGRRLRPEGVDHGRRVEEDGGDERDVHRDRDAAAEEEVAAARQNRGSFGKSRRASRRSCSSPFASSVAWNVRMPRRNASGVGWRVTSWMTTRRASSRRPTEAYRADSETRASRRSG